MSTVNYRRFLLLARDASSAISASGDNSAFELMAGGPRAVPPVLPPTFAPDPVQTDVCIPKERRVVPVEGLEVIAKLWGQAPEEETGDVPG